MRVMALLGVSASIRDEAPLVPMTWLDPEPQKGELLIRVSVCAVCHTELDEIEGRTPPSHFPMVLGHQIVGRVAAMGEGVEGFRLGERVGVGWIYDACGRCRFCLSGRENLCESFKATGRDAFGGYAEYMTVPASSAYPIPEILSYPEAAPLLCAGAIGYRSLNLTGLENGEILGLTGFGASGHLVLQMAKHRYPNSPVFVFARRPEERAFAESLGADWSGDTEETPPAPCDAIIDTTPVYRPVLAALRHLNRNGRLVINAIRKETHDLDSLLSLDYPTHLWLEKEIKSVANVTRRDIRECLSLAAAIPLRPEVTLYPLEAANRALKDLKTGPVRGAKVLQISASGEG